jgi:hypothetical protein
MPECSGRPIADTLSIPRRTLVRLSCPNAPSVAIVVSEGLTLIPRKPGCCDVTRSRIKQFNVIEFRLLERKVRFS